METAKSGAYYAIIPAPVRYDKGLDSLAKLIYAEISGLCNAQGYCWASNGYFAETEGVSERTVSRAIAKLAERGYIRCEMAATENGTERRIYAGIFSDRGVDTDGEGGVDKFGEGGIDKFGEALNKVDEFKFNNTPLNPPKGGGDNSKLSQPKWHPEWFNPLYDFYPNHRGRQDACRAWDKLKPDKDFCRLMYEAVRLQKRSVEWKKDSGAYIPHFSRWLNGRKWEDEVHLAPSGAEEYGGWDDDPEVTD